MKLRHLVLGFFVVALAGGCITYVPHAWTRSQSREPGARLLSTMKLSSVRKEKMARAIQLLENAEFVSLDDESAKQFAKQKVQRSPGEAIFLIRGVSWSRPPLFREIYVDEATRTIYVDSYTYNGEIFIPGKSFSEPSPIIACLRFTPSAVIPNAIIGGDRIAGRSLRKDVWREE